jgi:uncharacterized membrane protein YgcG
MDNQALFDDYLRVCFNLPNTGGAADLMHPIRNRVQQQGILTFRNLQSISRKDISTVCMNIRKPGGMELDGAGVLVPDRGTAVPALLELNLQKLWYYARYSYMTHTSRNMDPNEVTVMTLETFHQFLSNFEAAPPMPGVFTTLNQARVFFENLDDYFSRKLGVSGFPLSYVTREGPPTATRDGIMDPSPHEDLFNFGRHDGVYWALDNSEVHQVMRSVLHGSTYYIHMASFERSRNGHASYWGTRNAVLGNSANRAVVAQAEETISKISFDGKSKNFDFMRFVNKISRAFLDLGPDNQFNSEKKVTKLLKAINDSTLIAAKATIMATPHLRIDYDATVAYLQEIISTARASNARNDNRNLSSMQHRDGNRSGGRGGRFGRGGGGGRGRGGRGGRSGRGRGDRLKSNNHYNPNDPAAYVGGPGWNLMTDEQKVTARAARLAAGVGGKRHRDQDVTIQLAAINSRLQALPMPAAPPAPAPAAPAPVVGIGATASQRPNRPQLYRMDGNGHLIPQ